MILRYDQGMNTHTDTSVKIIENAARDDVQPGDHVVWERPVAERPVAERDATTTLRREGIAHHRDHYGDWCTKGGMWLTDLAGEGTTITIRRPAQDLLNRGGTVIVPADAADAADLTRIILDDSEADLPNDLYPLNVREARNLAHAVIELTATVKRVEALADDMDHDADLLDQTDDLRLHLIAATHREDATRLRTALNGDDR